MRRKDREMPEDLALSLIDGCKYASLATAGKDGYPYIVPLNVAREGKVLYFHCAAQGEKIENLKDNSRVCLCCVKDDVRFPEREFTTHYQSAVVRGTARQVTGGGEKIRALELLCKKHTPAHMENFGEEVKKHLHRTAVWRIEAENITGKRNAG